MRTKLIHGLSIILISSLLFLNCNKDTTTQNTVKPVTLVTPNITGTVWGASSAPFIGENFGGIESWKRLNDRFKTVNGGFGLMARRSYDTSIPDNFAASAMADDAGNCNVSFGSFKPNWTETANGSNSAAIKNFIQSIPTDRIVYLAFHHEPEDNISVQNTTSVMILNWYRGSTMEMANMPTLGWFLGTWSKNGDKFTFDDSDGTIAAYAQLLKPNKSNLSVSYFNKKFEI